MQLRTTSNCAPPPKGRRVFYFKKKSRGATVMTPQLADTLAKAESAVPGRKYRVQLDFSGKNLADLEQLKEMIGASARSEVVRDALRWLYWCAEEVNRGGAILLEKEGKQREVVFPFIKRNQ